MIYISFQNYASIQEREGLKMESINVCKYISDRELKTFIPDVYQHDILDIDYDKLWSEGVRLLSFDIDDTINTMAAKKLGNEPKKEIKQLFIKLHEKGFKVILLSNASKENAEKAFNQIEADGYIFRSHKPFGDGFDRAYAQFGDGIEKKQWAHIGNSMRKDVKGANEYGCISCLVRDMGRLTKFGLKMSKMVNSNEGEQIRKELKHRKLWYHSHIEEKHDQYYQFGEKQKSKE